jgi:Putative zinc- or iron-chelating domain
VNGPQAPPDLDVALLEGFSFTCRPDCGLCCYAEPRVSAEERTQLIRIVPEVEIVRRGGGQFLAAHAGGGACRLLVDNRCRAHDARPAPCREYPLTVHVGARLQATVVLSCPGVDVAVLGRASATASRESGSGFAVELGALRGRIDHATMDRLDASRRRRSRIRRALAQEGRWEEEGDVRQQVGRELPLPTANDFPVADPPPVDEGLEALPLFFDGRRAPVAIAQGLGGWELLELRPEGGVRGSLGVLPAPERPPPLEAGAETMLRGYLRYWLARDALFGTVHLRMAHSTEGTVSEWIEEELRAIGAVVLARAEVRAKLRRGVVDRLSAADLVDGIRATDQDLLDRDTWGDRL